MANWKRKPQEKGGTYFFSGQFYATRGVANELPPDEILFIYRDIQGFVREKNGIDYLQVYEDENGRRLFYIDQLNTEMISSGNYRSEDNHNILMFASEY